MKRSRALIGPNASDYVSPLEVLASMKLKSAAAAAAAQAAASIVPSSSSALESHYDEGSPPTVGADGLIPAIDEVAVPGLKREKGAPPPALRALGTLLLSSLSELGHLPTESLEEESPGGRGATVSSSSSSLLHSSAALVDNFGMASRHIVAPSTTIGGSGSTPASAKGVSSATTASLPSSSSLRTAVVEAAEWGLHPLLCSSLSSMGIKHFFPIQRDVIPLLVAADEGADVTVGDIALSAPTGSGKTLAYAIPLLHALLTGGEGGGEGGLPRSAIEAKKGEKSSLASSVSPRIHRLRALVLVPTRDLAGQVAAVFNDALRGAKLAEDGGTTTKKKKTGGEKDAALHLSASSPPLLRVAVITGQAPFHEEAEILSRSAGGGSSSSSSSTGEGRSREGGSESVSAVLQRSRDIEEDSGGDFWTGCAASSRKALRRSCGSGSGRGERESHSAVSLIQSIPSSATSSLPSSYSAPDIIIATPGRLVEHLTFTKGFTLTHLRYFVVDEADRLLGATFSDWPRRIEASIWSAPSTMISNSSGSRGTHAGARSSGFGDDIKGGVAQTARLPPHATGFSLGPKRGGGGSLAALPHDAASSSSSSYRTSTEVTLQLAAFAGGEGSYVGAASWPGISAAVKCRSLLEQVQEMRGGASSGSSRSSLLIGNGDEAEASVADSLSRLLTLLPLNLRRIVCSATMTSNPRKLAFLNLRAPTHFVAVADVGKRTEANSSSSSSSSSLPSTTASGEEIYSLPRALRHAFCVCGAGEKPAVTLHLLRLLEGQTADGADDELSSSSSSASSSSSSASASYSGGLKALVFTGSLITTHRLTRLLQLYGGLRGRVLEFSSSLSQTQRAAVLAATAAGAVSVLISSDVAARGIDLPSLPAVINYDAPHRIKTYVHRCGRAGRAGRSGLAYSLVKPEQLRYFQEKVIGTLKDAQGLRLRGTREVVKMELVEPYEPRMIPVLQALQQVLEKEDKGLLQPLTPVAPFSVSMVGPLSPPCPTLPKEQVVGAATKSKRVLTDNSKRAKIGDKSSSSSSSDDSESSSSSESDSSGTDDSSDEEGVKRAAKSSSSSSDSESSNSSSSSLDADEKISPPPTTTTATTASQKAQKYLRAEEKKRKATVDASIIQKTFGKMVQQKNAESGSNSSAAAPIKSILKKNAVPPTAPEDRSSSSSDSSDSTSSSSSESSSSDTEDSTSSSD